jgi:hypothetical protein
MLADTMMPESFQHAGRYVGLVTVLGFAVAFLSRRDVCAVNPGNIVIPSSSYASKPHGVVLQVHEPSNWRQQRTLVRHVPILKQRDDLQSCTAINAGRSWPPA